MTQKELAKKTRLVVTRLIGAVESLILIKEVGFSGEVLKELSELIVDNENNRQQQK